MTGDFIGEARSSEGKVPFSKSRMFAIIRGDLEGIRTNSLKRIRVVYQCQRDRNKKRSEIILEMAAKLFRSRQLAAALAKIFSRQYFVVTDKTLTNALNEGVDLEGILKRKNFSKAKFFVEPMDESVWKEYRDRFPYRCQTVVEEADKIARHEFDLLGSGPRSWGASIDWHVDPKSGYRWPKLFYTELLPVGTLTNNADVKLPWELSRMQHLPTLGKAYRITQKESYCREFVTQVTHWLDENPCQVGVNWTCPMETAIRIVNIIWGLVFIEDSSCVTREFKQRVFVAIWQHGQYLVRHLEYSIRPEGKIGNHNHYLSDVVGLVYLGLLFPEFRAAQTWLRIGLKGLSEEMARQVHADGADYESSTSYHRFVLELFTSAALLCRLNGVHLPEEFWKRLEEMYSFTLHVLRPDGKVPQIGDADDGRLYILSDYGRWDRMDHRYLLSIGATLFDRADMKAHADNFSEEAFWLLGINGVRKFDALSVSSQPLVSKAFRKAGFYVMRSGKNYVLACCNPVGTAGTGNHKHNDLLSFEFYAGDRPFIVDPGTYVYTASQEWRNRFRSTRFHNTVIIDGQEQNRFKQKTVFSLFADAEPIVHRWHTTGENDWLDAEHSGYRRLLPPVSHWRRFGFDKCANTLEVTDTLRGTGEHNAEWNFHFDHGIDVERKSDSLFLAYSGDVTVQITVTSTHPLHSTIEEGWVSRSYGTKLPAKILKLQGTFSDRCRVVFHACCASDNGRG
jgi:Heparinase II/III-like protein/Heparinase II/III N-terminus